jgi:hypothetical protein
MYKLQRTGNRLVAQILYSGKAIPMPKLIRLLVTSLLSLVLAVAVLPTLQTDRASAVGAPGSIHKIKLSPTKVKVVKLMAKARVHAMNQSGSVMNYTKMRKVFGKSRLGVSWRRQMAAGARQAGTKITHLSAAESRQIEKIRQRAYPCRLCLLTRSSDQSRPLSPPSDTCGNGESKLVHHRPLLHRKWQYSHYFNSCETNDLIAGASTCVIWAGLASGLAFVPGPKALGAALALVSAICGTDAIWLANARDNSAVGAIIIRYGQWRNQPKGSAVRDAGYFSQ